MQRSKPAQPADYYAINSGKSVNACLPPAYFEGFGNKLYVVTTADLKTAANPFLAGLAQNKWLMLHPEGGDNFESFAADLKRSMLIKIENPVTGQLETVFNSSDFFLNREDVRDILVGEAFIDYLYKYASLNVFQESHGLSLEKFKCIGRAYFQKCMYFINETILGALSDKDYMVMDATVKSDLIFYADGSVNFDLYQPKCNVICTKLLVDYAPLKAPCPTQIAVRIPFLQGANKFGHPIIFCNELSLPFLFSNKSVLVEQLPNKLPEDQREALQKAIEGELKDKSVGASKVKREPTKGKYAKHIILAVAGLFAVGTAVTLLAVPGGVAFLLGSLGLVAADGAVSAGTAAATIFAVAGIAGVTTAGATSTVYFTARAVIPRNLGFVMLDSCRALHLNQFELMNVEAVEVIAGENNPADVPLPDSPPASPRLFGKGKEEIDNTVVNNDYRPAM